MKKKYSKKPGQKVIAVQLDLETEGFAYRKWGEQQFCKRGDWLVNNNGDVYSVDRRSFAATYREIGPGCYIKTQAVWAEQAEQDGEIPTREGVTHYRAGDYLVYNDAQGEDKYAISRDKFESMYEEAAADEPGSAPEP